MTRTPNEINSDICEIITEMPAGDSEQYADKARRLHALWDELARVVTRDRDAPAWAILAVVMVRDQYARETANL